MKPVLDGVLDEATWHGAARLDRWVQTTPGDNTRPAGSTVAYLAYDRENLYFAIEATDEPGRLRVRRHARDVVSRQAQDWVSIQLDTYNDRRRAFGLAVNPLGLQGDGIQVEGSSTFEDWNGIWYAAGQARRDGFTVEIAVPFKSLRYPNRLEQRWGLALRRTYGRATMEDRPWPHSRDLACDFCQMATLTGIRDIEASRNIELSPTLVTRGQQDRPTPGARFDGFETRAELGGNLKVGVTPNLTFDGTYNPDFSQVESDAGQLEINNRFALFFPERRPFFLEGTDIFLTAFGPPGQTEGQAPVNVVHTRQILDPRGGLKLSGKVGRVGLGLIGVLDDARPYTLPRTLGGIPWAELDPLAGDRTRFLIGRAKLDVLEDGFVGLVATSRRVGEGYAYTAGGDFRVRFGPHWSLRGLYTHSAGREADAVGPIEDALRARLPAGGALDAALDSVPSEAAPFDGTPRRGDALQAQLEYGSRSWNAGLGYLDLTPRYRTEVGFTPRTDYAAVFGRLQYVHQGTGFFQRIAPQVAYEYGVRHRRDRLFSWGDHTDLAAKFSLNLDLPKGTTLMGGYNRRFVQVAGLDFSGLHSVWALVSSQVVPWMSIGVVVERERGVIFTDLVEGGDPKPATEVSGGLVTTFRPIAWLVLETELTTSRLWRRTAAAARASRYAESLIPRTRLLLQFTKAFGFRGISEYRIERFYDRAGSLARKRDQFMYDLLFTFLVQPQQSLHLGWTQLAQASVDRPMQPVRRGGLLKASYLWRF